MRKFVTQLGFAAALGTATLANAATIDVAFEIPALAAERYANPYVAIWAEEGSEAKPLLLWHLNKKEDKWLPDIKRWWRKIGRYDAHVDSLTGATRGPGNYQETLDIGATQTFTLYLEVVRENGGRSLVDTKIDLTQKQNTYTIPAADEIGQVTITINR